MEFDNALNLKEDSEEFFRKLSIQWMKSYQELTDRGPVTPNAEIRLLGLPRKLSDRDILFLAIASWNMDPTGRFLLQEEVRRRYLGSVVNSDLRRLTLRSEYDALIVLCNSFKEREAWGNYLPRAKRLLRQCTVGLVLPKKAKPILRRRGYRTTSPEVPGRHIHKEWERSEESTKLQLEVEEKRQIHEVLFQSFWPEMPEADEQLHEERRNRKGRCDSEARTNHQSVSKMDLF